ncbi:aldo/keto reductase [Pelagibacterium sp. 26DY04]|uniref:aldo/keto reductase n=1 Tax=Pelagibacterium sp. 26DY04 TaxID=2967130 RepID=UPI002815CCBE|nr:aldo/keto reductase [Pelagibacterium sp. 26DY04]WMT87352.1 aldo/keto reductase [Pelagibacterium sp. 26DY04]
MPLRRLGQTSISIEPLVLGGNVFGWTLDEAQSFAVLDAYAGEGFTMIDTADSYSKWVPGNPGGVSETIIGNWLKSRGDRHKMAIATKVGTRLDRDEKDLSAAYVEQACEASLRRLGVDHIDLYFAHWPDPEVTHEETLRAFEKLIESGKVGHIGCSNYDAPLLSAALEVSASESLPRYQVLENEYNLYSRESFESEVQELVLAEKIGVIVYYGLASGFLTGKYRSKADFDKSQRGGAMGKYLNEKGFAILAAMDKVAGETGASHAEIALAWLAAQPGVTAPIASATSVEQVESLARGARLELTADQIQALSAAGR